MNGEFWQLPGRKGILAASRQEGYAKKGVRRGPGVPGGSPGHPKSVREAPRGTQNRPKSLPGPSGGSEKRSREATRAKKCRKKRPGRVPGSEKSARGGSRGAIFVDFRSILGGFSRFVEVCRVDSRVFCRTCRHRQNTAWAESKLMSAGGRMPRISRISAKNHEVSGKFAKLAGNRRKSAEKSAPGTKKCRKKRPGARK